MTLLSIFHTGGLTLGLTLVWLVLTSWFTYNLIQVRNAGYIIIDPTVEGGITEDKTKVPIHQIGFFWFIVIVTVAYIFALTQVASDYRDYNPKKDGVPKVQTDSTRQAAEDMIQ